MTSLDVVWFERKGGIHLGAVKSEGPKKVTLVDERGETLRIPRARLLGGLKARVEKGGVQALREALRRLRRDLGERADPPDLSALWAALEDGRGYALGELVEKSFAAGGDPQAVALVDALCPEGRRVERRFRITGGGLQRVDSETLERLAERDARQAREAEEAEGFLAWWKARAPGDVDPPPTARPGLELLKSWALEGDRCEQSGAAKRIAARLGQGEADVLLVILEREGLLPRDVNELPARRGVRVALPKRVREAAQALLDAPPAADGEDLTALPAVAVDDPGTTEVDDALSAWEADGARWLAVHIARPEELVPDGPLDVEAQKRATSVYFPGETIPMLPPELVAARWSLLTGQTRPALSLIAKIGADDLPTELRFARTQVRVDQQVTYEQAGAEPPAAEVMAALLPVAHALRRGRQAAGARIVRSPQLKLELTPDGPRPKLTPTDLDAHVVVSELMVFYNAQVAARLAEARAPALFRTQAQAVHTPNLDPNDSLRALRARRGLPPTQVTPDPGPHRTMGLEAYLQATSPLRRLGDLIAQRQLLAQLDGAPPPYDRARIEDLLTQLNKLERRARQLEDERIRYLLARWLETRDGPPLEGAISRGGRRPAVFLYALERELPLRLPRGEDPVVGRRIQVRPWRVDPRAREIVLERA